MTIYSYGCTTCGKNGHEIRKAKRKYFAAYQEMPVVIDTKISPAALSTHQQLLKKLQPPIDNYPTIVVQGKDVIRLTEWLT